MWPCIISLKVQSFLLYYFETNLSIVKLLLMKIAWKVVLWSSKDEEIAFIRVFTFSCIPCGLISLGWHCQKNNVKKWAFGKTVYSDIVVVVVMEVGDHIMGGRGRIAYTKEKLKLSAHYVIQKTQTLLILLWSFYC